MRPAALSKGGHRQGNIVGAHKLSGCFTTDVVLNQCIFYKKTRLSKLFLYERKAMAGFVYIMSNPSFVKGRIKIGKSDRDPLTERKAELETTGVPEPFRVEYFALVHDHHALERELHREFANYRVNKSREFFDVDTIEVVRFIRQKRVIREFGEHEAPSNAIARTEEMRLTSELEDLRKRIASLQESVFQDHFEKISALRQKFIAQEIDAKNVNDTILWTFGVGFGFFCFGILPIIIFALDLDPASDASIWVFYISLILTVLPCYLWRKSVVEGKIEKITLEAQEKFRTVSKKDLFRASPELTRLLDRQQKVVSDLESIQRRQGVHPRYSPSR